MTSPELQLPDARMRAAWLAALAVAALGTWICYAAFPGINWLIWCAAASLGLVLITPQNRAPTLIMCALATILAGGASITDDPFLHFIILVSVTVLLAMAMLLSASPFLRKVTAFFTIAAPIVAFGNAIVSAVSRTVEATHLVRSPRARGILRGAVLSAPVLIAIALLLAVADPTFASWRNAIRDLVANWDFVPRTIFFIVLMVLTLGAYGYALDPRGEPALLERIPGMPHSRWLGNLERWMLLGSVTALLWLFLLVQVSYLFGNLPSLAGSGITFAEYARRGFAELTIVAVLSTLIIIVSERYGEAAGRHRLLRPLMLALIVAVLFLLASAFYRVLLYEEAYGFTTARLYAQAFMIIIATALVLLSLEVRTELDPGRFFRRIASAAAVVLVSLIYWNHEAWIAHRNIDRYAATGKLDAVYLTRDLSPNAVPAVISRIPSLPEPARSELTQAMTRRYVARKEIRVPGPWFEWNLRRIRARKALESLGLPAYQEPVMPTSTERTRPRTPPSPSSRS